MLTSLTPPQRYWHVVARNLDPVTLLVATTLLYAAQEVKLYKAGRDAVRKFVKRETRETANRLLAFEGQDASQRTISVELPVSSRTLHTPRDPTQSEQGRNTPVPASLPRTPRPKDTAIDPDRKDISPGQRSLATAGCGKESRATVSFFFIFNPPPPSERERGAAPRKTLLSDMDSS